MLSGPLGIGLIVVLWLCVLLPLILRNQKPISRTDDAFDRTRVVLKGDEENTHIRRRPRFSIKDEELILDEPELKDEEDLDPLLVEEEPAPSAEVEEEPQAEETEDTTHEDAETQDTQKEEDEENEENEEEIEEESEKVSISDAYIGPSDLLHPGAYYESLDAESDSTEEPHIDDSTELTPEEMEFARRRRGRGGYDPQVDAANTLTRYQRRKRTLIGLLSLFVLGITFGFISGGSMWVMPIIVAAITALYLWALRRNVKAEQELRVRRIQQMRRARLGVRNTHDDKLGIPQRLRRPGAIVVESHDESPDFEMLPLVQAEKHMEHSDIAELDDTRRAG